MGSCPNWERTATEQWKEKKSKHTHSHTRNNTLVAPCAWRYGSHSFITCCRHFVFARFRSIRFIRCATMLFAPESNAALNATHNTCTGKASNYYFQFAMHLIWYRRCVAFGTAKAPTRMVYARTRPRQNLKWNGFRLSTMDTFLHWRCEHDTPTTIYIVFIFAAFFSLFSGLWFVFSARFYFTEFGPHGIPSRLSTL